MREQDIQALDLIFKKLYDTCDYLEVNSDFFKKQNFSLNSTSISRLTMLVEISNFANVPSDGRTDQSFKCRLSPEGLRMMIAYGSFSNYINDFQMKRISDNKMIKYSRYVAYGTIATCLANILVAIFK